MNEVGIDGSGLPATIPARLAMAAERHGDLVAVVDGDESLTYAELLDESRRFGAALVAIGHRAG